MGRKSTNSAGLAGLVARGARRLMGGEDTPAGVRLTRRKVMERLDGLGEALAWAEAGEQERAAETLRRDGLDRKRILALGRGAGFAPRLAEFALGLADRLRAEVVFLSVLDAPRGKARNDAGQKLAVDQARPWLEQAQERGVAAQHLVRSGDPAAAVAEVCAEVGRVEIVLSEPQDGELVGTRAHRPVFTVS